jgi:NAD(P)-dependent dehydrogenase (short-subunit alcohol dehydrogenase family)
MDSLSAGNPLDLSGRRILVTGASGGIGREAAILLSTLNARLVLVARNAKRLEETAGLLSGADHAVEPFDLSMVDEVPAWMRRVAAERGPLSGIVHAAAKYAMAPAYALNPRTIEELMKVNVGSALMLARAFCHKNCRTAEGSIVFLSSIMGLAGKPAVGAYSATKAALLGLTRSLAIELAPGKVRVNCIVPGCVETDMLAQIRDAMTAEQFAALEHDHPLGFGRPCDIAYAVAFLLADTGRWITGTTLVVDGGYLAR